MIDLVQYRTNIGLFASITSRSAKKRNTKVSFKTVKNSSKPTTKIKTTTKDEDVTRGQSFICLQLLTVVLCLHVVCSNQFLDTDTELLKHSDICGSRCTGTEILHCNVYGSVECWEILDYGDVGSYNNNMLAVNYSDTLSYFDASFKNRHHVKYNNHTIYFHGNRSEHGVLIPSENFVEYSYFICQSICNGTVIIQSLEMCPYPGTCCYLLGNKGMHCYNGNPPTGLNSTEEAIKKQRLCVLFVDGGSQALRYTISRIVLKIKLQNVDGQTRGKLCVNDKNLLYPAGSVLPSLDGLTQAGLDMVWTKALQQRPVTSGVTQDMIYDYLVSDGLDLQLKNNKQRVQALNIKKKILNQGQWDILYPQLNVTVDLESFDMTLLCFVILNVFQFKPTSGIWSHDPPAGDVGIGDDILRLRKQRNKLAHSSSSGMDDSTFQTAWTEIRDVLVHLKPSQEFSDRIKQLHDCQLVDPEKAAESEQLIVDWINHDKQLEHLDSGCNYSLPEKITMLIIFGLVLVISLNFIICEDGQGGLCFLASGLCGLFVIVIIVQRHIRGFVDCGEGTAVKRKGKRTAKSASTTGEPFSRIEKSIPTNELNALHYAQYSVGLISIMDSSPDSTQKIVTSTGTGFVVGDGHLMTACHVISEKIENILATITQIVLRSEDSVFERWKTHFFGLEEMEPYAAVKGYYEKSERNLEVLISSFEEYVTEEDYLQLKQVLVRKWHDEVTVQFENKNEPVEKYTLSPDIPFLNENIDVAILKIESKPGCKLPESLRLADSDFHHEKVNIFGYIKKIKIELALDPKCEVYTKSSNLEKNVTEAINWWEKKEQEVDNRNEGMYDKINFEEEYKDCVIKDSEVLLHASPSFVHGTSGSPMIEFKETRTTTHPVVVGIYLRGYPMFYYKIKKAIENRGILTGDCRHFNKFIELVRENEEAQGMDKIIRMRYFIEGGTTMKHLADSLPVSDMRDMLFPNRRTEGQRLTLREEESDSGEQFRLSTAAGQLRLQHPEVRLHQSSMGSNIETRLTVLEESTGSPAQLGGAAQTLEDRPQYMLSTVEAWRKEDIYVTKCVTAVKEKISSKGCVCVIGVPGAGKSTALHHAALSLESEGFTVYFISGPEKFLEKYYDSNKKQVFVLDDALGVYSVDQGKVKLWQEHDEIVRNVLGTNTKLLVSIRTQIFRHETIRDKNIVFLDKSETTDHVDYSDADYKLELDDMIGMLTHYMRNKGTDPDIIDNVIEQVWGYTEKQWTEMTEEKRQREMSRYTAGVEFADCFPLLCKVYVNTKQNPSEFFKNPFPALTKVFQNIKTDNKLQFCALVLCTMFNGKLTDDLVRPLSENPHCDNKNKLDKDKVEIRNYIMSTYKLKCPDDLEDLQSALNSLTGVYILHIGDTYKISHAVFHDIVTYLYNDPLFVFNYGTREFIRDRVRLNKDEQQHDPYIIVYSDDTNIERLADRLFRDYKSDIETGAEIISRWLSDPWTGARFITENPNIHDDRLFSCLRSKLSDREQTDKKMIDDLFTQCMWTVYYNSVTYKHGDVTQYKLIELCLQREADYSNMYIGGRYPLHLSVMTGSLQLTQLLLQHGADKRRVGWYIGDSVLHWVCSHTSYNRLDLIKLLTQDGDLSVVKCITSDKQTILQILDVRDRYSILHDIDINSILNDREILEALDSDSLQLEEVLSDNSIKVLTTDKHQMKDFVESCKGKLNLVKPLPDNILTYVDSDGCNILHYLADDSKSTSYVLGLISDTSQAVNQQDKEGRKPYWYVLNKQRPGYMLRDEEKLSDKDREDIIQLYKDNHAIL